MSNRLDVFAEVKKDLDGRNELGKLTYGRDMDPHDRRDWLINAYEEALDMVVYLKAELIKRGYRPQ